MNLNKNQTPNSWNKNVCVLASRTNRSYCICTNTHTHTHTHLCTPTLQKRNFEIGGKKGRGGITDRSQNTENALYAYLKLWESNERKVKMDETKIKIIELFTMHKLPSVSICN